jgi:hypothetical protein
MPEWVAFRDRIAHRRPHGAEEYGLTVGIHAHAAGFIDFEPELERLLDEVDDSILKICFDTGHHSYAGFDPVAFMRRHIGRISYMHFKDIDPVVKADAVAKSTGFYDACGQGIFCNLGTGRRGFPGGAADPAGGRIRGLVHGRTGLRPDAGCQPDRRCAQEPRLPFLHRLLKGARHGTTELGHDRWRSGQPDRPGTPSGGAGRRAFPAGRRGA